MTTDQLLGERVDEARAREAGAFDALHASANGQIVLSGAGNLGQTVLSAFRSGSIEPLAFIDRNPSLWGKSVAGVTVYAPEKAAELWGSHALFVVTTFRPLLAEGIGDRLRHLAQLGCKRTTSFLPILWKYPRKLPYFAACLPSSFLQHADKLRTVNSLWHDNVSRELFLQQLMWRLRGDFSFAETPTPEQYFPRDVIAPNANEKIVDGGAYDGDTLLRMPLGFARAWAVEPDPLTAARLRTAADRRMSIFETALGSKPGYSKFDAKGTTASARSESGCATVTVSRLDDLLAGELPTYLKLDVEGDEFEALEGGRELIRRAQPVVAVCLYHRPDDLWKIPLLLHNLLPSHRQFLRIHEYDGFELVAYAVPSSRCC